MSLLNSFDADRPSRPNITGRPVQNKNKSSILRLLNIPVVFLSYDEPNADENFEYLKATHPNPKIVHRVHGVKGFDAAHKAACNAASGDRFFTVDADCKPSKGIWTKTVEISADTYDCTFSWSSVNIINGLVYGNGGIKLWYSEFVRNMKTHEAAKEGDETSSVEFCWDGKYKQMNETYGVVHNNATSYQAFRAGFREGIKMGLDQGHKVNPSNFNHKMYPANYARWLIWMTIGRDVENGIWAMYGARLAAHMLYLQDFDHTLVNDYDWFNKYWEEIQIDTDRGKYLEDKAHKVLIDLRTDLKLPLVDLDADQSTWFKHVNFSPSKGIGWPALLNQSALPLYGFSLPKF